MAKELSREEYEDIIKEKRHEELSGALKNIALSLSEKSDKELLLAVEKQIKAIEGFASEVSKVASKEQPKVEVNQDKVTQSISEMGKTLREEIIELRKCITEKLNNDKANKRWDFDVVTGYGGRIEKIIATQK